MRRLCSSERLLARWLYEVLGTVGADSMVRRYGVRAIVRAIRANDVVEWVEAVDLGPDGLCRSCELPVPENCSPAVHHFCRHVQRLRPSRSLRNPGGFLRFVLRETEEWS